MRDVGELLRETDPVAGEPELSAEDAYVMRRRVLAATREVRVPAAWPQPLTVAATIALTLTVGVVAGRRLPSPPATTAGHPSGGSGAGLRPASATQRRQLHFATPGGTRIIWVFNPDFEL